MEITRLNCCSQKKIPLAMDTFYVTCRDDRNEQFRSSGSP